MDRRDRNEIRKKGQREMRREKGGKEERVGRDGRRDKEKTKEIVRRQYRRK